MVAKTYHRYLIIAEQKLRTQIILGGLLNESDIGKGRPNKMSKTTTFNSLKDVGINRDQSSAFQKIASLPQEIFEEEIATAKEETNK